ISGEFAAEPIVGTSFVRATGPLRERHATVRHGRRSSENNDHLAAGFVGLHYAMRLTDLPEPKDAGWLRLVTSGGDIIGDALQRDVRKRKAGGSEDEAAEERQIDATCHLQKRVEIGDRGEAAKPTSKASATTTAERIEGIKDRAVPHKVEHRIKLLGFGNV